MTVSEMISSTLPPAELVGIAFAGPMMGFNRSVVVDLVKETNSNRLSTPGECDPRVNTLLPVVKSMDYPESFADK
ncbi:hypothetical protein RJ639_038461 [Escallonia herrerae]|uniref:Uncharacterized protein n=1 Tax=Escallonia herrerae TaxID=1293975 RepID=A0AA88X0G3_9ASTE|nr:hypothetical protein RJ639_038461 [Escallonia herrerae]